jgi:cell division protein FtsB
MFDFYQRRKLKGALESPVTRIILLVLCLVLASSAYARFKISKDVEKKRLEAEAELKQLEQQKETLEDRVQYLSDDRGIEAEMRRQFDVALQNEQVVVIVEPEEAEIKQATSTYTSEEPAWYEFWR